MRFTLFEGIELLRVELTFDEVSMHLSIETLFKGIGLLRVEFTVDGASIDPIGIPFGPSSDWYSMTSGLTCVLQPLCHESESTPNR